MWGGGTPESLRKCNEFRERKKENLYIRVWKNMSEFSSVAQSCLTLCDPINCSTPGPPVHHQLPEFTQTHVR